MTEKKKSKTIRVSEDEYTAIQAARVTPVEAAPPRSADVATTADSVSSSSVEQLTKALADAINSTRPPDKITVANRKSKTPWSPPEGTPRSKFKRRFYHHGISLRDGENLSNVEIDLLNEIRPGRYMDGHVNVKQRKDRGVDIDYKVSTASDRLRLVNQYKITSFEDLLQRIVAEHANPEQYRKTDDLEWQ
jgi:hypothetical protein